MAESTLSITFDDLQKEVAFYLGLSRDSTKWSASELESINSCIKSGLRQFYCPDPLPGERIAHDWSFLRPIASFVVWSSLEATSTNTVTGATADGGSNTTLTATLPTFVPSMVGSAITLTGVSGEWTILSYTSSTVVKVSGAVPSMSTPRTFSMTASGDYPLPDDFGGIDSPITVLTPELGGPIPVGGEASIRASRQYQTVTGKPTNAAVVPDLNDGTGQRFTLMLFPTPEVNYTLQFRYRVLPDALTTGKYAYGGSAHAETVLESCLAVAEKRMNDTLGIHRTEFANRLRASVSRDRLSAPHNLGYNGDNSDEMPIPVLNVTFNGVQY